MNILLISPLPPPSGGIATWTEKYCNYCKINHISVDVVNIAIIGNRKVAISNKRNLFDEIKRTFLIYRDLEKKIKHGKYDVAHLNTSCEKFGICRDLLIARIIKKNNIPLILEAHCNLDTTLKKNYIIKCFEKLMKLSDHVLVLNDRSLKTARKYYSGKIQCVPNFIDDEYVIDHRDIAKKLKTIVYTGHVQEAKGCHDVLEVAKRKQYIQFYLVGAVNDQFKKYSIPSNVHLVGEMEKDEVVRYLKKADLYIFLSYSEGFSVALLEAMALGLPIIATDVGANKDMIADQGGRIITVGDIDAATQAVEDMEDYKNRSEASAWNIRKVRDYYTMGKVISQLIKLYDDEKGKLN